MLLTPAAGCSQLIAGSTQEDLALKEQESRTKVLPKYLWLEASNQKHSKTWCRCGESFHLPLHSACTKSVLSGFASQACGGERWGWQPGMPSRSPCAPAWVCVSGSGSPVALLPCSRSRNDDLKMKQGKKTARKRSQPESASRAHCHPSFS